MKKHIILILILISIFIYGCEENVITGMQVASPPEPPPAPICGNGPPPEPGEECDDGNKNMFDQCANDCKKTYCGDNYPQWPNGRGTGGPNNSGYEQCDDGDDDEYDECYSNCEKSECGDGTVNIRGDPPEQCDGDNYDNPDTEKKESNHCVDHFADTTFNGGYVDCIMGDEAWSDNECMLEFSGCVTTCGNDRKRLNTETDEWEPVLDEGEDCDDSNDNEYDQCANDCTFTYCGDEKVQRPNGKGTGGPQNNGYEQCDDGNEIEYDECSNCARTRCGDGKIQKPNSRGIHELCDGNDFDDPKTEKKETALCIDHGFPNSPPGAKVYCTEECALGVDTCFNDNILLDPEFEEEFDTLVADHVPNNEEMLPIFYRWGNWI